jgi:ubiquinone/menaquinone biosynthesis C-methylase UbiE
MKLNWAERWAVNNPFRPLQQKMEINWMKKRGQLKPGAFVAEMGCGRGAGADIIKREFQPRILQAMDVDILMLRKAIKHLSPRQREGISFYAGDISRLPYRGGTLDAVFGFGVLHHIPDWQGALAEIVRVLKAGGFFFFEELYPSLYQNFITKHILLHPARNRFYSEDLKRNFKEVGFHLNDFIEHRGIGIFGIANKQ